MQDRKTRAQATLTLEQGKPLVFGTPEGRKGIVVKNGSPSVIDLAAGDDPVAKGVVVHDEKIDSSSYAGMLATLQRPEFPVPIGVFRSVERPTYEDMLQAQVDSAIAQRGRGNLKALLHSGDTWQI
jgi:2-oxoglutarate ferredoxin oxidoreductase subunit beta